MFTDEILAVAAVVTSPFAGSFIGVLAVRCVDGRPLIGGRSECDHCGHKLGIVDLVPVVSWLTLRGRCRYCHRWIGCYFPLVELAAVAIAVWAAWLVSGMAFVMTVLLGWLLLALAVADGRSHRLPDGLTFGLLGLGLVRTIFASASTPESSLARRLRCIAVAFEREMR